MKNIKKILIISEILLFLNACTYPYHPKIATFKTYNEMVENYNWQIQNVKQSPQFVALNLFDIADLFKTKGTEYSLYGYDVSSNGQSKMKVWECFQYGEKKIPYYQDLYKLSYECHVPIITTDISIDNDSVKECFWGEKTQSLHLLNGQRYNRPGVNIACSLFLPANNESLMTVFFSDIPFDSSSDVDKTAYTLEEHYFNDDYHNAAMNKISEVLEMLRNQYLLSFEQLSIL